MNVNLIFKYSNIEYLYICLYVLSICENVKCRMNKKKY